MLQQIGRDILAGTTLLAIVRRLNTAGIPTKNGNKWRSVTVRQNLLTPAVAGLSSYRGEIVGKASWPAVIPEDDWYAIRSLLQDPARRSQQGTERRYQGSGVYRCGKCGNKMFAKGRNYKDSRGRRVNYICMNCNGVSRQQPKVDEYISEIIFGYLSMPENQIKKLQQAEGSGEDVAGLLEERRTLAARKDSLGEMFASGVIDKGQLIKGTQEVERRVTNLDKRITLARKSSPVTELILGEGDIRERWDLLPADTRAEIIDTLLSITILPGRSGRTFKTELIDVKWKD